MLQMTVDGQEDVDGAELRFYGVDGSQGAGYALEGGSLVGEAQRTILLATPQAAAQSGFPAPDFELDSGDALVASAGALCVTGPYPADCASWGSFPQASALALPDPQSANAEAILGSALGRSIGGGCSSWLDPDDDNRPSSAHFFDGVTPPPPPGSPSFPEAGPPPPRSNADGRAAGLSPCALTTAFNITPRNPTNDTTPGFVAGTVPPEYGAEYSCRFAAHPIGPEGEPPFEPCGATIGYGPLADGSYDFEVFASGAAGPDPTPIQWTFTVDTVPPDTTITSTPGPISSGFSASFSFASSEEHPTFRCRLDNGPNQTCDPGKTFYFLADGHHTFRVWAADQATNRDPSAAEHTFFVDSAFGDTSPPFTEITAAPPRQTKLASARFAYTSNEPGSRFECRVDAGPFAPCAAAGAFYPGLRNGLHLFAVRAVDRAGNADPTPATHAWTIDGPVPETKIVRGPSGVVRLGNVRRRSCAKKRGRAAKRRCRRANRRRATRGVVFAARSSLAGSSLACRIDARKFRPCRNPMRLRAGPGRHRFEVYAIDALGNRDPSPARRIFRVLERGANSVFGKSNRSGGRRG